MDELRPFQDPDLSSLQAGSACLAKHQDGLWYPARITGEAAPATPLLQSPVHPSRVTPLRPLLRLGVRTLLHAQGPCSQLPVWLLPPVVAADLAVFVPHLQTWTVATTQSSLTPCC